MKQISKTIVSMLVLVVLVSCTEDKFANYYPDPSKLSQGTVDKQFTGFLQTNREYVLPAYWNYFVVLRNTLQYYNQAVGWINANNQYVPGAASISDRWGNYYELLSQYRELEKIYNNLSPEEQALNEIYMITATIYLYDFTQVTIDLHGDIPFTEAGKLSQNGGDYIASLASYDSAEDLYTMMLDDLSDFSQKLGTINVNPGILVGFGAQDYINKGDIEKWQKFCNSLRLRMLTRVSGAGEFSSRAQAEINEILNDPTTYPIVETNDENIQITVYDLSTPLDSEGFQTGLEDWNGNIAGKAMIDHMLANGDPRLRAMFEPGENNAEEEYIGLDPLLNPGTQETLINSGELTIYNRSTLSRNDYFPGLIITAWEVNFLKAEAYVGVNDAMAKEAYERGITESINFYYQVRELSNDATSPELVALGDTEISDYLASAAVSWDNASSEEEKMNLIATQKWLSFNVIQPYENWAELRRLNAPELDFWVDPANAQSLPPNRWIYPNSELVYNTENYNAVKSNDNLSTKIFWDID
ncbi:SusD/RagB family nutrient-binding outer membrane lipoprotein [Flagellimonas taeanensis]|nr:SusD/RagB family nutrient-binding outer membrane lipoprotein [Allomuricauda taeanensis]